MGDIADEHANSMWDEVDFVPEDEDEPGGPSLKTCKFCKQAGLHWVLLCNEPVKWRLADAAGKVHACRVHFASKKP